MSSAPGATSVVEHEIRVAARPETVFAYFIDPAKMVRWMGTDATLDPRAGGMCRIKINDAAVVQGEFVEVDPPRRIVLTWGFERNLFAVPPQSSAVEITFTPDGEETIVRLAHRQLTAPAADTQRLGWQHYLKRLVVAAGGGTTAPDPWRDVEVASRALGSAASNTES